MAKASGSRTRRKPELAKESEETKPARPGSKDTMPLMGIVTWTDPQQKPTPFVLDVEFAPGDETAHLCLSLKLRAIASIEFRPVRRPLRDSDGRIEAGHVADAERLANMPL